MPLRAEDAVKWFGENWGAPICRLVEHAPTPQADCLGCNKPIKPEDQGVMLPYSGSEGDPPEVPYHLDCFLEAVTTCTTRKHRTQS